MPELRVFSSLGHRLSRQLVAILANTLAIRPGSMRHDVLYGGGKRVVVSVPGEVVEAAVRVCGRAFHYKDQLRSVLISAGVPGKLFDRWNVDGASKYVISRHVLTGLISRGSVGQDVVRRVFTDLANLTAPDAAAPDQDAGRLAIRDLRALARARQVLVDSESAASKVRRQAQDKRVAAETARARDLEAVNQRLVALTRSTEDRQRRGYALERLLVDLFTVFELSYRPPYKIAHAQIDAAFDYRSLTYLVEARWRPPCRTSVTSRTSRRRSMERSKARGAFSCQWRDTTRPWSTTSWAPSVTHGITLCWSTNRTSRSSCKVPSA